MWPPSHLNFFPTELKYTASEVLEAIFDNYFGLSANLVMKKDKKSIYIWENLVWTLVKSSHWAETKYKLFVMILSTMSASVQR